MKKQIFIYWLTLLIGFSSCNSKQAEKEIAEADYYYTCPMHPTVRSDKPGVCPICSMALVKVKKHSKGHDNHASSRLIIDEGKQLLANIAFDTVKTRIINTSQTFLGTVASDENSVIAVNSRIAGRIDEFFVKSTGEYVKAGAPLYSIYSEELLAEEKEYLNLLSVKKQGNKSTSVINNLLTASKEKLLLWGLKEQQIKALEKHKETNALVTFYAPGSGYVTEIVLKEGGYVKEGSLVVKLTDLNKVWVEAQVYSNEINAITKTFDISSEQFPEKVFKGTLAYENPIVEEGKKTQLIRIAVDNINGQLVPGTMVYVQPTSKSKAVVAVAKTAILEEQMQTVWVKINNTNFEQRMIKTGKANRLYAQVTQGLKEGEIVVTTGAYLLNSEFILKNGATHKHVH